MGINNDERENVIRKIEEELNIIDSNAFSENVIDIIKTEYIKAYEKRNMKSQESFSYIKTVVSLVVGVVAFYVLMIENGKDGFNSNIMYLAMLGLIVLFSYIGVWAVENTVRTYQIAGQLHFLELYINALIGKKCLVWESKVVSNHAVKERKENLFIIVLSGLIGGAAFGVFPFSILKKIYDSYNKHNCSLFIFVFAWIIVLFIILAWGIWFWLICSLSNAEIDFFIKVANAYGYGLGRENMEVDDKSDNCAVLKNSNHIEIDLKINNDGRKCQREVGILNSRNRRPNNKRRMHNYGWKRERRYH